LQWLGTSSEDLGLYWLTNTKNWRQKSHPGIQHIPGSKIRRTKKIAHKQGKEDAPDLSTESGADNTASCMKRQSDEF
jgi:hypothetical protein